MAMVLAYTWVRGMNRFGERLFAEASRNISCAHARIQTRVCGDGEVLEFP